MAFEMVLFITAFDGLTEEAKALTRAMKLMAGFVMVSNY